MALPTQDIQLLDGKTYTFSRLPFNRKTVGVLRVLSGENKSDAGEMMTALLDACELSLAITHGAEEAARIINDGLIPFPAKGDSVFEQIQNAIIGK